MVWPELRAGLSARMKGMAVQNGPRDPPSPTPQPSKPKSPASILFRIKSWSRLRVRTRFRILDVILNCVLFTPLAVLFQVGACGIHDFFFLKYVPPHIGTIILLSIGIGIEFSCSLWQQRLSELSLIRDKKSDDTAFILATRLYHFAVGFANVCHYRGLSDVYYNVLGYSSYSAIQGITATVAVLLGMRCARNILGPPLCLGVDSTIKNFFETTTYFRTKNDRYVRHLGDNLATVLSVTSLCFLHWIAVWAFFDAVLFPENLAISVIASWIIGYAIVIVAFFMEGKAKAISSNLEANNNTLKTLFEDVLLIGVNIGVILIWRGHWIFFESGLMYYFPIYHSGVDISAFYAILSSFVMMCLLHTSATLIMKGCDFDGELGQGEGVSFGVDYFAEFFQEEVLAEKEIDEIEARKKAEEEKNAHARAVLNNNMYRKKSATDDKRNISLQTLVQKGARKKKAL